MTPKEVQSAVREALTVLVQERRASNDAAAAEALHDRFVAIADTLPREGILDVIDQVVGTNAQRKKVMIYLLIKLADSPPVVERIRQMIGECDHHELTHIINGVGERRLIEFAPFLNEIFAQDIPQFCGLSVITTMGKLQQEINIPVLLEYAASYPTPRYIYILDHVVEAMARYAREEFRPFLERAFDDPVQVDPKSFEDLANPKHAEWYRYCQDTKIQTVHVKAAEGLVRLRHPTAFAYLVNKLDDKTACDEAALAIRRLKQWDIVYGIEGIRLVKERIVSENSQEFLAPQTT